MGYYILKRSILNFFQKNKNKNQYSEFKVRNSKFIYKHRNFNNERKKILYIYRVSLGFVHRKRKLKSFMSNERWEMYKKFGVYKF